MKILLLLMGITISSYAASGSDSNRSGGQLLAQQSQSYPTTPSDCSHLSDQEKQFAMQLSDMHRTMFCRHFSVTQRMRAMALVSPEIQSLSGPGAKISPDGAVEAVMKDSRQNQAQSNGNKAENQGQNPYSNYSHPNSSAKPQSNPYSN